MEYCNANPYEFSKIDKVKREVKTEENQLSKILLKNIIIIQKKIIPNESIYYLQCVYIILVYIIYGSVTTSMLITSYVTCTDSNLV